MNDVFFTKLLEVTVIAGVVLGFFISLSLITSPFYKSKANNYLAISLFILTGITFLGWYGADQGLLLFLQDVMWELLLPVTFSVYFLLQIEHPYPQQNWFKLLYLPFLISFTGDFFLALDYVFGVYALPFEENNFWVQLFYNIEDELILWYNIGLMVWARRIVHKTREVSQEKQKWLLRLNLFIFFLLGFWFISEVETAFFDTEYIRSILWAVISFLFWWVLYYGIFKLQIIIQRDEITQYLNKQLPDNQGDSKGKESLSTSKYIHHLYELMEKEQLYKNALLSRLDLANKIGISESYLSQLINQETGKSVIQFVNAYRVELAKKLLRNQVFDKYSVEAIGLESGFKSKSTFYETFKMHTQMSPGAFRKYHKTS